MRRLRIYLDTSVLGAVFDEEFREATMIFFEQARVGRFDVVLSALAEDEIARSPANVREFCEGVIDYAESVTPSRQAINKRILMPVS